MVKLNVGMKACGIFLLWATAAVALPAQTFTSLHSFNGTAGEFPLGILVQATDGNLYGTTLAGGPDGEGTFFKITTDGALTTLYDFSSADGASPYAGVVQGTDGNFYGTTSYGGNMAECGGAGCGTVFKITPTGGLTTLYEFCQIVSKHGRCLDGINPMAPLILGDDGDFYGTTTSAGTGNEGGGTVFRITPSGALTTLYSFCSIGGLSCPDGHFPFAGLLQASDGNFYGTTVQGGHGCPVEGCGTVFKITPSGEMTTLYRFSGPDGTYPVGTLVQGADGWLYGGTEYGGANDDGTIFKISTAGALTTLFSFDGANGKTPYVGVILGTNGNFYGTTLHGGPKGDGTIFEMTSGGKLTELHGFDATDGADPSAGLAQDTDGSFYGTTYFGGAKRHGHGTVFSLSVGLGAFVKTLPTFGTVGETISILGSNLTGSTKVTFHGIQAAFTVVSNTEITATVPTGATTGTVKVVTPGGTLSSNVPFRVTP